MSLETKIAGLSQAIGTDIKTLNQKQGALSSLSTTNKVSLVAAINELTALVGSQQASSNIHVGSIAPTYPVDGQLWIQTL